MDVHDLESKLSEMFEEPVGVPYGPDETGFFNYSIGSGWGTGHVLPSGEIQIDN